MTEELRADIENLCGDVRWEEPMHSHTTFKIGGPAECFASPSSAEGFISLVKYCDQKQIPFFIVGNGSNLLVSDSGVRGVVIHAGKAFGKISLWDGREEWLGCGLDFTPEDRERTIVAVQSGALMSAAAAFALKHSLAGLEFASGIPGTLGGGFIMNAGAYDGEISQVCAGSLVYDVGEKQVLFLNRKEQCFGYRSSIYQEKEYIVLMGFLGLEKGNPNEIREKINDYTVRRREKQPIDMPSAGSTFKRPRGAYAAKLIEECGLKGLTVGGAQVSVKHSGFLVNIGNATCADVVTLIQLVRQQVQDKTGYRLEPEVKWIGDEKIDFASGEISVD